MVGMAHSLVPFSHASYTLVRPLFSWRRIYRVYAPDGSLAAFVEQPWFRWRSEWTVYQDEEMTQPILVIKNRRIAAINMEHDLFDAQSGARLGVVRTRGLRSIFRDHWDLLDADEQPVGEMMEAGPYLLRRFIKLIPGRHRLTSAAARWRSSSSSSTSSGACSTFRSCRCPIPIEPRFAIACSLIAIMADLRREERS